MSIELDNAIRAGEVTIAAIVKRGVHACCRFPVVSIDGAKRPVAILISHHNVTTAFEIDGVLIDLGDLEQRYPGQRAAFESLARSDNQNLLLR